MTAPVAIQALRQRSLAVGVAGLLACLAGAAIAPAGQFYRSWLFGFLFWIGVGIGCESVLMIQHLTGGLWGLTIRRILEAGSRTLLFAWILFVPLALFGLPQVFVWANHSELAADHHLEELVKDKQLFLNVPFFLARAGFYFAVWAGLAHVLSKLSLQQDAGWTRKAARQMRGVAGGGLLLMGLTISFSAVDWAMSLDPRWFSHIYGVLFMVGQALSALALSIVVLAALSGEEPLRRVAAPQTFHDLGKLMFAFVMLWAYVNLSQFLIMWSGNLPEETPFYLRRREGGWAALSVLLVVAHFVLPFLLLLSRDIKRNARLLATIAAGLLLMRVLDLYWLIGPELHRGTQASHALDLIALVAIGGLWIALFAWQLGAHPLLPLQDPELAEAIEGIH